MNDNQGVVGGERLGTEEVSRSEALCNEDQTDTIPASSHQPRDVEVGRRASGLPMPVSPSL